MIVEFSFASVPTESGKEPEKKHCEIWNFTAFYDITEIDINKVANLITSFNGYEVFASKKEVKMWYWSEIASDYLGHCFKLWNVALISINIKTVFLLICGTVLCSLQFI